MSSSTPQPHGPSSPRSRTLSPMSPPPARNERTPTAVGSDEMGSSDASRNAPEQEQDATQGASTPDVDSPRPTRNVRLCGVCQTEPGKYKCPKCNMPYCSVTCSRTHNANHPPVPEKPAPETRPAPAAGPPKKEHPFAVVLDHRDELDRLFEKYPNLQAELARILQKTRPPVDGASGGRGSSLLAKLGGPGVVSGKNQTWTPEIGLRRAMDALRKARTDPTEKGDGVREFCEFILYLLSKPGGNDVTKTVRQEVAANDTDVIAKLLREERDDD